MEEWGAWAGWLAGWWVVVSVVERWGATSAVNYTISHCFLLSFAYLTARTHTHTYTSASSLILVLIGCIRLVRSTARTRIATAVRITGVSRLSTATTAAAAPSPTTASAATVVLLVLLASVAARSGLLWATGSGAAPAAVRTATGTNRTAWLVGTAGRRCCCRCRNGLCLQDLISGWCRIAI